MPRKGHSEEHIVWDNVAPETNTTNNVPDARLREPLAEVGLEVKAKSPF